MAKPHDIVLVPSIVLRKKSIPAALDKKTKEIADTVLDTLKAKVNPKGVGLSAPQVGKNIRLFATWLDTKDYEKDPTLAELRIFINPVITDVSKIQTLGPDEKNPILEGCLSIPGLYGPVPRYTSITLSYITLHNGEFVTREEKFVDFFARVIQHEYDHLEGILYTDYSLRYDLPVYEFKGKKATEIDKHLLHTF